MSNLQSGGGLRIGPLVMKQFEKRYFETYSDAEIWIGNTRDDHDGIIRKDEYGKYYIFVKSESQEKQSI